MGKRVYAVLAAAVIGSSGLVVPAPAPQATAATAEMSQATADTALAAARATGQLAEVAGLRTETQRVFADPSGAFTLEQHALPVRVRRSGGWVSVDTTLRRNVDGTIGPVAAAVDLAFSGGGTGVPLARIAQRGGEVALGWPARLPVPELNGSTATYREVLPGVDLAVSAGVLGFSEVLIVRTPAAARQAALAEVRFTMRTAGLSVRPDATGNVALVDIAGNPAFHSGTPLMWDSGDASGAMRVATGPGELVVRPDAAILSDPKTRYPVYVDPGISWTGNRQAWVLVRKAFPNSAFYNPSGEVARVGHETQTGMTDRSLFRMNTSTVRGEHILKATFRAHETWSWYRTHPHTSGRRQSLTREIRYTAV